MFELSRLYVILPNECMILHFSDWYKSMIAVVACVGFRLTSPPIRRLVQLASYCFKKKFYCFFFVPILVSKFIYILCLTNFNTNSLECLEIGHVNCIYIICNLQIISRRSKAAL